MPSPETALRPATTIRPDKQPGSATATLPPAPAAPLSSGQRVGPYVLGERIGRGGLGDVYRARHAHSGDEVALKFLRAGGEASAQELRSFERELETARRLWHPGILPILDAGTHDGVPYYTMPLVSGGSLEQRLRAGGLSPRQGAALLARVARAVHAAHDQGVIHRDLKPGNVLLSPLSRAHGESETEPKGRGAEGEAEFLPLVADFGLARFVDQLTTYTVTGLLVGSLPYMAPEQAAGRSHTATAATDVWALGVILYEILAGHKPFRGSQTEILHAIQHEEPPAPGQSRAGVPRPLEAVCLRCLRKNPRQRYASAADLAADLERWLAGEDVSTHLPVVPSAAGALLRHPAGALLGAAAAAFVALALLAPSPAAEPSPDETAQRRLQAALRRARPGKPVELLSQGRTPTRAVFALGEESSQLKVKPNRPTWINAPVPCLLELLPADTKRGPYRLTVEMAQTDGEPISQVGVYAGHRPRPAGDGKTTHGFAQATWCEPKYENRKGQPSLSLRLAWFLERPHKASIPNRFATAARLLLPNVAPAEEGQEFRTITIEVRPERMGIAVPGRAPVMASRADLERVLQRQKIDARLRDTSPELDGYSFDVSPEGGAGLVLWRGAVEVRRAVYEPIPR